MGELIVRREGPVGTILFSNVARHNAMSYAMWHAFPERLHELDADPSIRVIVLTGDGRQAFVSGADISQYERNFATPEDTARTMETINRGRAALRDMAKPILAMIRGYCLGGGLGVALLCDMGIASEDSRFGIPATRLGIAYSYASSRLLCDRIGVANAREIQLFTDSSILRVSSSSTLSGDSTKITSAPEPYWARASSLALAGL